MTGLSVSLGSNRVHTAKTSARVIQSNCHADILLHRGG